MFDKLNEIKKRYEEIGTMIADQAVVRDVSAYQNLIKEQRKLDPIVTAFESLQTAQRDIHAAKELGLDDEVEKAQKAITDLKERLKELLVPRDSRDDSNVIVEIRPAAGGDEATLFASALFRMYCIYADSCGFSAEVINLSETEIGGIKEVSFMIIGDGAYSKFKFESGVHRVQRVPDTETQGRIHTSTCTVAVLPEVTAVDFKIDEKDLRIDVYRSSGAGGQHVNRTESAVRITHLPTGTVVTCQDGRSQIKNREKAMLVLQSKLADFYQSKADANYASQRKSQIGTGDRSERIRTYNFPQDRVTDHRIGLSLHNLPAFMSGRIGGMIDALHTEAEKNKKQA